MKHRTVTTIEYAYIYYYPDLYESPGSVVSSTNLNIKSTWLSSEAFLLTALNMTQKV